MKSRILTVLLLLLANNVFAQNDNEILPNNAHILVAETSFFESIFGASENSANENITEPDDKQQLTPEERYRQLEAAIENYKTNADIKIESLRNDLSDNTENIEKTVVNLERKTSKNNEFLRGKYKRLDNDFSNYRKSAELESDGLRQTISELTTKLNNTINDLSAKVKNAEIATNQSLTEFDKTVSQNTLYGIISFLIVALLLLFSFLFSRRLVFTHRADVSSSLRNTRKALEEEHISLDNKLLEIVESQLSIIDSERAGGSKEENHTLALKVADEIVRIQKNISRMDDKTKGLKQLTASVSRIGDNFASNGYEIVDMINKPYNDGMKVSASFIPDENLEQGQQIITRIIKPQVNYQGVMIQSAQIEVSIGG